MKSSKITVLLLSLAMLGLSIGCMSSMNSATPDEQAMQQDMASQKKIIAKLKKELNGYCDEIGRLDKKLQTKNYTSVVTAKVNDALMGLRKSAWETRATVVSGDIMAGKSQLMDMKAKLTALSKEMDMM
ncbi:MAG: hypothetical protein CSA29_00290 [Desulfobacterales bacterium]|nr:MAG: hypothetical protein CSA29_00290 [Desulfobacterales bacterium]